MPFVDATEHIKVTHETHPDIVEGEWFVLRKELNKGQEATYDSSKLFNMETANMFNPQVNKSEASERMNVTLNPFPVDLAKLKARLVDWYDSRPINEDTIKQLHAKTFDALVVCCEQLEADEDKKRIVPENGEQDPKE